VVDLPTNEGIMIYDQLMGVKDNTGHILLLCGDCNVPAQDAKTLTIMKMSQNAAYL
jgi:hypothetical protein